jgi:predicted nucleic acid-binding protein
MKIVSDTGPIIGLAKIGRLDLLKSLGEEVGIPPFVHRELFAKTGKESSDIDNALKEFIRVVTVNISESGKVAVLHDLDEGERQAIALASALGKDVLLLMDDHAGRQAARELGVPVTGLLGLVLLAKEKGLVNHVGSLIEELREAGYWLSDEVMEVARKLAGE